MRENLLDRSHGELVRRAIADAGERLLAVNPSSETIRELVSELSEFDGDRPTVELLGRSAAIKDVMDDFIVASNAADLVESGDLELRVDESASDNPLLVSEDSVVSLVDAGRAVGGLVTTDDEFVEAVAEDCRSRWEAADEYSLRTPALSDVRDGLSEELGEDVREDFSTILGSLETARGNGDGLDEVTISLLVAAKNEELLYDVSKWGEDTGVASKATFSRTKSQLEDMGLIDTEKVPIDVGRPRLRLTLADDRLKAADNDQIATVAQSILN